MCAGGQTDRQTDSWRVGEVEVSLRQEMLLHVFTKEISVCYTFVNVMFNGVQKFAGTSGFEGLTLLRDVNQERVHTILVTEAH